jgi:hypothetical protein
MVYKYFRFGIHYFSITMVFMLLSCFNIFGQKSYRTDIFNHDSNFTKGHFYFNHAPQILVIDSGEKMPNSSILQSKRIIVNAYGGQIEAQEDQAIWSSFSDNFGRNWSKLDTITKEDEVFGPRNAYNGSIFKTKDNKLVQIYSFLNSPQSSTSAMLLRYKYSLDGGLSWSQFSQPYINGILDTLTFKFNPPFGKPIYINPDTLILPTYFRNLNNNDAYFGILTFSEDLKSFSFRKYTNITLPHPDRLVEPIMIKANDTLYTYFRTTTGRISYIYSTDLGLNWSQVLSIDIKNPGTKFELISDGTNVYLINNLSVTKRNNLYILKGNQTNFKVTQLIDQTSDYYDQVSYPAVDLDNDGFLHVAYSAIGYDTISGLKYGDIKYFNINKNDLDFEDKSNIKLTLQSTIPVKRNIIATTQYSDSNFMAIEAKGFLKLITNQGFYQAKDILDSNNFYYSIDKIGYDSVLISTSNSVELVKQFSEKVNFIGGLKASKIINFNSSNFVNFLGKTINLYHKNTLDTVFEIRGVGTKGWFYNGYGNVADVQYIDNDSFLIINDFGYLTSFKNGKIYELGGTGINYTGRLFINKDNMFISTINGKLFVKNNTNWDLVVDDTLGHQLFRDNLHSPFYDVFLAPNSIVVFDKIKHKYSILNNIEPNCDLLKILSFNSADGTMVILDSFGKVFKVNILNFYSTGEREIKIIGIQPFVFPNPSNDKINVVGMTREINILQIIGISGNVIKSFSDSDLTHFNNYKELSISDLPSGLYLLQLNDTYLKFVH